MFGTFSSKFNFGRSGQASYPISSIAGAGPTGWYNVSVGGTTIPLWVDQDYDGGGWICVLANRKNTTGMSGLSYSNATTKANYKTGGVISQLNSITGLTTLDNYNIFIGTSFWKELAGRNSSSKVTVVQFVSGTNGTKLSQTTSHNRRYRWRFDDFVSGTYAFSNAVALSDETSTGSPGLYNYHAVNRFPLATSDSDPAGCPTYYNNNPWWYGWCWSGSYFGGGGSPYYQDGPYWNGSGSDYYQYGGIYIK